MGVLVLVRHGQASLLEKHYDKLSPAGEEQSRLLGAHLAARRIEFHEVFSGPRDRHLKTAEIIGEAYTRAGLAWKAPAMLPELDEYHAELVLKQAVPVLAEKHVHIRSMREAFHGSQDRPEAIKNFQKLFETVIKMWAAGDHECPDAEPWGAFAERVGGAIRRMTAGSEKGRRVLAITSGGPIAVAMQMALNLDLERTLQTSWMSNNSSASEFLFSADRLTLSRFNSTPHLQDTKLLTYW